MMKHTTLNQKFKYIFRNTNFFFIALCFFLLSICSLAGCSKSENNGYVFSGFIKYENLPIENVEILVNDISLYPQVFTDKNGYFSIKNISDSDKISFKHTNFFFSENYVYPKQNLSKNIYKLNKKVVVENPETKNNDEPDKKEPEKENDNIENSEKETFLVEIVSNFDEFVSTKTDWVEKDKNIALKVTILDEYNFLGWFKDGKLIKNSNVSNFDYKITKDTILRAKFEKKQKAAPIKNLALLSQNESAYAVFNIPVGFSKCKININVENTNFETVLEKIDLSKSKIMFSKTRSNNKIKDNSFEIGFETKICSSNINFYQIKLKISDSCFLGEHKISIKNIKTDTLWSNSKFLLFENLAILPKIENCYYENKIIHFELNLQQIFNKYRNFSLENQNLYCGIYTNGIKLLNKTLNSDDICKISNDNYQYAITVENLAKISENSILQLEIISKNCIFTWILINT